MAKNYVLKLYTSPIFGLRHAGYILEEYDGGSLTKRSLVELSPDGFTMRFNVELNLNINEVFGSDFQFKEVASGSNALNAFNKMATEATILDQHSDSLWYGLAFPQ